MRGLNTLFARVIAIGLLSGLSREAFVGAQTTPRRAAVSPWAAFVEPDFPFFSSVLDARNLGDGWPADNLTPRGLILNLGEGYWACFDTDLLRVAAIWKGAGVTPVGMAQGSYHEAGAKAPEGQGALPKIAGTPWMANGLYPGWQIAEGRAPSLIDPRPAGPDRRELSRGPLDPVLGRFRAVRLTANGVVLEYDVHGATVQERFVARDTAVERHFRVEGGSVPLEVDPGPARFGHARDRSRSVSERPYEFGIEITPTRAGELPWTGLLSTTQPPSRWPQTVSAQAALSTSNGAFVVDRVPIPTNNPWRRNVRLADIAFFGGGRAAAVTFDGDVWTIDGLTGDLTRVTGGGSHPACTSR